MSRIAGFARRPLYLIPSVAAVVALLALTLFPWKVDQPGSYHVAFAGVDKDLALQQYGVKRVLVELGIPDANVVVGDCEATCNLTIKSLRDQAEIGKVVSAMTQLSDCKLLEIGQDGKERLHEAMKNELKFSGSGQVGEHYVHTLSDDDVKRVQVVVRNVRFGTSTDGSLAESDSLILFMLEKGQNIELDAIDSLELHFESKDGVDHLIRKDNSVYFGDPANNEVTDPLTKGAASAGPINGFQLNQNYPNPFNAATTITFYAPEGGGPAILQVYNVRGQLVKTLLDHNVDAGTHEFTWDATDQHGTPVASGIYLYRLTAGDYVESRKMSLLK